MSRLLLLAVIAATAVACGNTTTVAPTVPTVTDTFTGTLEPNAAIPTRTFTTARSGTVVATLAALSPDSTVVIGMAIGTWNGNLCQIVLAKDDATVASIVTGSVNAATTLCLRVYDVGNLVAPTDYTVNVLHP